jgi:Ca-activated chloride channel homolog
MPAAASYPPICKPPDHRQEIPMNNFMTTFKPSFLWPEFLWLLLLLPLLVLLYLWLLRRKKKIALRYASLSIVREAMGKGQSFRRHIPPLLFLMSLAAMLVASSRPSAVVSLPSQRETIMLAMDVSGSMRATDVLPNRLVASQNAAKAFLTELPRNVRVGIVAFAGTAAVVQPPTLSREDLVTAIDKFQLQRGTAIGNGIVVSLSELFPDAGIDLASMQYGRERTKGTSIDQANKDDKAGKKEFVPVAPGSYTSAAIILLTDGQRTTGVDSLEAAKAAADRGVRVYTVGVGTVDGETIGFEGWSMRVKLDEETLKGIARATQAEYFYAGTAADLKKVYETLSSRLAVEKKETEISGLVALLAAALAVLSAGLSLAWFNRIL